MSSADQRICMMRGLRMNSPGWSFRCTRSIPARMQMTPSVSRLNSAAHWPDQPMAVMIPAPFQLTLKNGQTLDERPPVAAKPIVCPQASCWSNGSQSSARQVDPLRRWTVAPARDAS